MEARFHLLNDYRRFSAVVWLWSLLNLAILFWLKILLLPIGVWSLGWLAGTCRLWGRFENLIQLCEWGFTFEPLPFVMGFYFALLCLNDCLDSAITCFNFLNLLWFGLMDPLQWYRIRFSSS